MTVDLAKATLPHCPLHPAFQVLPGAACPDCGWSPEDEETGTAVAVSDEVQGEVMVTESFEGADVTTWDLKLPATTVECDQSYKRGSVLKLQVEIRLRNVGYTEKRDGTMVRTHVGVFEDVSVMSVYDPNVSRENVAGSLSGDAEPEDAEIVPEEPGLGSV